MDCISKLFVFRKIFKNTESLNELNIVFDNDNALETDWDQYWLKYGEKYVNLCWLALYKDYINPSYKNLEEHIKKLHLHEKINDQIKSADNFETIESQESQESDWQHLWEEHYQETYEKCFYLYHQNFYEAQRKFNCFDLSEESSCGSLNSNSTNQSFTNIDIKNELLALGLPTSFTCSSQFYKTQGNKNKEIIEEYSDESDEFITNEMDQNNVNISALDKKKVGVDKAKNRRKRKKNYAKKNMPCNIVEDESLHKYWKKRFHLFSRFDEGIKLDKESWFSVTPEKIAINIAERMENFDIVIDGFCGSGGNCIQLAKKCKKVIAIDIDPNKIELAKHNAKIYQVDQNIEFIIGDFLQLCDKLKADAIFLSPPWGGPKYIKKNVYDIEKHLMPISASHLIQKCQNITNNIGIYLPRNSDKIQIVKTAGIGEKVEIIQNYLDSRIVALTVFYGNLITSI